MASPWATSRQSSHTARGVVERIFNTLTTNGDHLFTYHSNLVSSQLAIEKWVKYAPLFDPRQPPHIEVAVYYPSTSNQLDDAAFRHLYAWGFNPRAAAVRRVVEVDYLDDHLIRQGFLGKSKVLVCVWGDMSSGMRRRIGHLPPHRRRHPLPLLPRGPMRSVEGTPTSSISGPLEAPARAALCDSRGTWSRLISSAIL